MDLSDQEASSIQACLRHLFYFSPVNPRGPLFPSQKSPGGRRARPCELAPKVAFDAAVVENASSHSFRGAYVNALLRQEGAALDSAVLSGLNLFLKSQGPFGIGTP